MLRLYGHRSLALAFALSLLLHLTIGVAPGWLSAGTAKAPSVLKARLLPPAHNDTDSLLKNTLSEGQDRQAASSALPPKSPQSGPGKQPSRYARQREQAAQRKLAAHLYYPEEAVARGWEGEVRLLLRLDESGHIVSAEIAAPSGHAVLDRAALAAAYQMGSLPEAGVAEFVLPVVFRLQ